MVISPLIFFLQDCEASTFGLQVLAITGFFSAVVLLAEGQKDCEYFVVKKKLGPAL